MSEEFDKEAEREKLREKLERDEAKRQETQRMSELLLQGATMTNEHCDTCGDPLFRDGGRTFCPTCGGADGDAEEQAAAQAQPQQQTQPSPETQSQQPETAARSNGTEPAPQEPTDLAVDEQPTPTQQAPASTPADAAGARAELQRAVTTTARKASESTDPRTAKEWLEASKEAAAALAALEQ